MHPLGRPSGKSNPFIRRWGCHVFYCFYQTSWGAGKDCPCSAVFSNANNGGRHLQGMTHAATKGSAKVNVVTDRRWNHRLVPGLSLHIPEGGPGSRNKWLISHVLQTHPGLQLGMGFVLSFLHVHDECSSQSGLCTLATLKAWRRESYRFPSWGPSFGGKVPAQSTARCHPGAINAMCQCVEMPSWWNNRPKGCQCWTKSLRRSGGPFPHCPQRPAHTCVLSESLDMDNAGQLTASIARVE